MRRLWAVISLLGALAAVVLAVWVGISHFPKGLTIFGCLVVALAAAWWAVCRRGAARLIGVAVAGAFVAGAIVLLVVDHRLLDDLLVLAAFAVTLGAARMALRVHVHLPPAQPPARPVLFYNPKSGDGKAERFHLAEEARRRRLAAVELKRGDDLERLVRDAVAEGADGLAMAGGDGSQAVVAMIASELGLPYACIPSGTRNHFALDLGVDRDDVVGALEAFVDGGERVVDLAEVNGRVFVNNVSLGLYAEAVQRPGYRAAKLQTLLDTVPDVLGPGAAPSALHWSGPRGPESGAAVLVSNNQYRLGRPLGSGTRPRLDTGLLGMTVLIPSGQSNGSGHRRRLAMQQWTDESFVVEADGPVPAGIDGEAVVLEPPLRFRVRPRVLRVRIAPDHPGASPSALLPDTAWRTVETVAGFAWRGEPRQLTTAH